MYLTMDKRKPKSTRNDHLLEYKNTNLPGQSIQTVEQ